MLAYALSQSAHVHIVFCLADNVIKRMVALIEEGNPVKLWSDLEAMFAKNAVGSSMVTRKQFYLRTMKSGETVKVYYESLRAKQQDVNREKILVDDEELATVMLCNEIDAYPDVAERFYRNERNRDYMATRLNHISFDATEAMNKHGIVEGVKIDNTDMKAYDCVACIESRMKRMSYAKSPKRETHPLSKISLDICSVNAVALCGGTMFLLMVDEATRYKWAFVLKTKKDAAHHIQVQLSRLSKRFEGQFPVKVLHSDQGGEFLGMELRVWCESHVIEQHFTNAYSPEENAIVERANGAILQKIRTMLNATRLPDTLWGEAIQHVIDTDNVSPTEGLHG
ncbi:TPA: hypothetical protein N0F65_002712 [Lagenidium giganteum]|uniref:Integrase catalytic domain-containing protein n=1 Tax=Lagenidium giganteum TaxID=4803 RepID=A0AAV2Z4J9_9STRA|nr:TPA: hypothetical protein N0F65_002712 [Lagenidium giganteum]